MPKPDNILPLALRRCRPALLAAAGFSLAINVLVLTVPIYMLQIFDRVLISSSKETLFFLTLIGLGALLVLGLLEAVRSRILVRVGTWLDEALSPEAFVRAIEAQLRSRPYRLQALRDLTQLRQVLSGNAIISLFDSPWVPIFLGVIFLLHPWLGWLATGGAILLFALAWIGDMATRKRIEEANNLAIKNHQSSEGVLRNAEAIDAMGMLEPVVRRWRRDAGSVLEQQQVASSYAGSIVAVSKFFRLALQLSVLGLGAYLVIERQLTAGGMIAASIILSRALAPVEMAIGSWRSLLSARQAKARLHRFFEGTPLRQEGIRLPQPAGRLTVEAATFKFPEAVEPALKKVSFAAGPGETVAVVGPSASGKTTLSRLLVGTLRPNTGSVRLDDAEIYSWPRDDFGQHMGYMPQDVELLDGTVFENIARFQEVPEEVVVTAAQTAGCHEMILRLANGYNTEIGESGSYLSAGQRQRVALARAILGGPCLVVLDEPNANLDGDGEMALLSAIESLRQAGVTVIMVTHRPSLIQGVDKILVLRDGAVQAFGPRDQILQHIQGSAPAPETRSVPRIVQSG